MFRIKNKPRQSEIVPSYYEEFGYTAAEMLSFGLPVICSYTSGLQQLNKLWSNVYYFKHDNTNIGLLKCLKNILDAPPTNRNRKSFDNAGIVSNFKNKVLRLYGL